MTWLLATVAAALAWDRPRPLSGNQLTLKLSSPLVSLVLFLPDENYPEQEFQFYIDFFQSSDSKAYQPVVIYCATPIDSDSITKICESLKNNYPVVIQIVHKADPREEPSQYVHQKPENGKTFELGLSKYLIPYSTPISSEEQLQKFIELNEQAPLILYSTKKANLPKSFKSLTTIYRNNIAFCHTVPEFSPSLQDLQQYPYFDLRAKKAIPASSFTELEKVMEELSENKERTFRIRIGLQNSTETADQNLFPVLTPKDYEDVVMREQQFFILCLNVSGPLMPVCKELENKMGDMFSYYSASEELIAFLGTKRDTVTFIPKELKRKATKRMSFTTEKLADIVKEISTLVDDPSVHIADNTNLQAYISTTLTQNQKAVILFYKDRVPLAYKVVADSEFFKEHVSFFKMTDPASAVMQNFQFQSKDLPLVMLISRASESDLQKFKDKNTKFDEDYEERKAEEGKSTVGISKYPYGKITYRGLLHFVGEFVPAYQDYVKRIKHLPQVDHPRDFKEKCGSEKCYLLLLDGARSQEHLEQQRQAVVAASAAGHGRTFVWIDANCHSELLQPLGLTNDQLPSLVLLYSQAKRFFRMTELMSKEAASRFISKAESGKAQYKPYEKLVLRVRDCQEYYEELKGEQPQGEGLTAEEKEALQRVIRETEQRREREREEAGEREGKKRRKKKQAQDM